MSAPLAISRHICETIQSTPMSHTHTHTHAHLSLHPTQKHQPTTTPNPHRTPAQCPTTREECTSDEAVPLQLAMVLPSIVTEPPSTSMPPAATCGRDAGHRGCQHLSRSADTYAKPYNRLPCRTHTHHAHLSLHPTQKHQPPTTPTQHQTPAQCPTTREECTSDEAVPLQLAMVLPSIVTEPPSTSMPPAATCGRDAGHRGCQHLSRSADTYAKPYNRLPCRTHTHTRTPLPSPHPEAPTTHHTHPHQTPAQCPTTREECTSDEVPLQLAMVLPSIVTEPPSTSMPPAATCGRDAGHRGCQHLSRSADTYAKPYNRLPCRTHTHTHPPLPSPHPEAPTNHHTHHTPNTGPMPNHTGRVHI